MSSICRLVGNACSSISSATDVFGVRLNRLPSCWRQTAGVITLLVPGFISLATQSIYSSELSEKAQNGTLGLHVFLGVVGYCAMYSKYGWLLRPNCFVPIPSKGTICRLVDDLTNEELPVAYRRDTRNLVRELIQTGWHTKYIARCWIRGWSDAHFNEVRAAVLQKFGIDDMENGIPPQLLEQVDDDDYSESAHGDPDAMEALIP